MVSSELGLYTTMSILLVFVILCMYAVAAPPNFQNNQKFAIAIHTLIGFFYFTIDTNLKPVKCRQPNM